MNKLLDFRDKNFIQYSNISNNPSKFILFCAIINRLIQYINKGDFANFESFLESNPNKDLFLTNSKSEFIIKNFENDNCKFSNDDYIYVLQYMKDILKFDPEESEISQEISKGFQKTMSNNHNILEKSNGGIFNE